MLISRRIVKCIWSYMHANLRYGNIIIIIIIIIIVIIIIWR